VATQDYLELLGALWEMRGAACGGAGWAVFARWGCMDRADADAGKVCRSSGYCIPRPGPPPPPL